MTLGQRLRGYLPRDVEQKVIAMNWLERIEAAGLKGLSPATVPSRLSELLADDPQGVRAFFRDPRRANALFDELNVPEDDRAALRALAEPILAGTPQPRLVVDLSDLGHERAYMDAAFLGIRVALFGDTGVFPVALVLTDAQYDLLPRSFDDFKDRLQIERVPDDDAGAEHAVRLVGDALCLLSQRPLVELSRWWAASVERGALALEPADGLEQIRASGRLGLPHVAFPLPDGGAYSSVRSVDVPKTGVPRRRLVKDLAEENSAVSKEPPFWRQAAAAALGVQATSTQRERIEAELAEVVAQVGLPVSIGSAEAWDELLARAARRPTEPTAMRVGDQIRALNPPEPAQTGGRLLVHRQVVAEPQLTRLERALAGWTEDDLLDDPLLLGLVHRLAGDDPAALKLLLHARAVIVYGHRIDLKPTVAVADPLGVMATLLAGEVPEALIRLRYQGPTVQYGPIDHNLQMTPFVYPKGGIYMNAVKGSRLLVGVPPTGDVLWSRETQLRGAVPKTGYDGTRAIDSYGDPKGWNDLGKPAALVNPRADAASWLDDVEASPLFGAPWPTTFRGGVHLPEPKADHEWQDVESSDVLWLNADTNLALAWLAVRDSLAGARWIRLPDGSVLLQVGGGLAARIRVRRHGAPDSPVRAALRCTVRQEHVPGQRVTKWTLGDLAFPVTTHVAHTGPYTTRLSVLMPSVWLAGMGFAADLSFIPAPMLPGGGMGESALHGATQGALAAAEAARAQADDD